MTTKELYSLIKRHATNAGKMNTKELYYLIKRHGITCSNGYVIGGRRLLEHITDVPGFVSLLGGYQARVLYSRNHKWFIAKYPKPINTILNDDITFYADTKLGIWNDGSEEYYSRKVKND
jgi:hypothetical protein